MPEHTEESIEKRLRESFATAPRLTPENLDAVIKSAEYHVFSNKTTVCCLTLRNGFTVVGVAACVDSANFREQIGRDVSFTKARNEIWPLEGYLLQQHLFERRDP
jgi:hypothetical protein